MNPSPDPNYKYQFGGSLPKNDPSYVTRQADSDLYNSLKAGEFCYVLNSRQMGKSSLRVRVMQRLQQEGIACADVDISVIDATPEQWYAGIIDRIAECFSLQNFDISAWWENYPLLSPAQRFRKFIENILLKSITTNIVIFFDEIDSILSLEFNSDDFFATIRECYNRRADKYDYRRLTFAILGVSTPSDLIQDKQRTPFNIGKAIDLTGFQFKEAKPLEHGLKAVGNPQVLIKVVLDWTGGQPFLTQKVCQLLVQSAKEQNTSITADKSKEKMGNISEKLEPFSPQSFITDVVQTRIIENWETQDVPEHLKTIRNRLLHNRKQLTGRLLGLYQQVLQQREIVADESPEQRELRLTGLVVQRGGKLKIYNRIYKTVFNQEWCEKELKKLRPYAESLNNWVASEYKDESYLLQQQNLQDALSWAADKSLNDLDYKFLAASQDKQAKEVLAEANRKAERQILIGSVLLGIALRQARLAQQGTRLEQSARATLARFEFDAVEALLTAIKNGNELKELAKKNNLQKLEEYPTVSPILALQNILDKMPLILQYHQHQFNSAYFNPDGEHIVIASNEGTAQIWNLKGELVKSLEGHEGIVTNANYSPDGKYIITSSTDKTAIIWDLKGNQLASLKEHKGIVTNASYSPDGKLIVTTSSDKTAIVWDSKGKLIIPLKGHEGTIWSGCFSPDGKHIITASHDGTARIWNLKGEQINSLKDHKGIVTSASFSPNGKYIVTTSSDKTAIIWNSKGEFITFFQEQESIIWSASFSADGKQIVTASNNGIAQVWDLEKIQQVKQIDSLKGHKGTITSASYSPDGRYIVTASTDKTVRVWLRRQNLLEKDLDKVDVLSFSPNGNFSVTTSNKTVWLCELKGGQNISLKGHQGKVNSASFSPDGQLVVTASDDKTARIWDLQNHNHITLLGHDSRANIACFSPNGQLVVTGSDDRTARVWDLMGRQIATYSHSENVVSATFSSDGKYILTITSETKTFVWEVKSLEQLIQHSCKWVKDNFTYLQVSGQSISFDFLKEICEICSVSSEKIPSLTPTTESSSSLSTNQSPNKLTNVRGIVVIDPGHGIPPDIGSMPGIDGLEEEDVVLPISQKIAEVLEKNNVPVILTRDVDTLSTSSVRESLKYRVEIAERFNASVLVSIHANAFVRQSAKGLETFAKKNSKNLAQIVHSKVIQTSGLRDRRIKSGENMFILRECSMPAIIVEVGFITNPEEAAKLKTPQFQTKIAEGIASGILEYLQSEKTI